MATTTTTVTIITILLERGYWRILRRESQLNVPIDTIIMTATSAAIGMALSQSLINTTIINRKTPALNDDKRVRPPDFTLIMD